MKGSIVGPVFGQWDRSVPDRKQARLQAIENWIHELASSSPGLRQQARARLIEAGLEAVPGLVLVLQHEQPQARLDAVRTLAEIQAPSAAPALVKSLQDEDVGVRWAAREALIALGGSGVEPLLRDLIQAYDSIWLREGAQHILSTLKDQGCLAAPLVEVLKALGRSEPEVRLRSTAASAWQALFGSPEEPAPWRVGGL